MNRHGVADLQHLTVSLIDDPVNTITDLCCRAAVPRHLRVDPQAPVAPIGTTFSFMLDQPAIVTLRFTRTVSHRTLVAGALPVSGHVGRNGIPFEGRFSRTSRLQPGHYMVAITAINGAGQSSAAQPLRFAVVK